MGGTVKKIATVAAVAYGGYLAMGSPALAGGAGIFGTTIAPSTALAAAGLGLNVYSQTQQRKYAKRQRSALEAQAAEQRKAEEQRARYSAVQARRRRQEAIRVARIRSGEMLAGAAGTGGGLGVAQGGGTSGLIGGIGSVNTQMARQIGDINVAESTAQQISQRNIAAAGYATQAMSAGSRGSSWSNMASLGTSIFSNAVSLASLGGTGSKAGTSDIKPFDVPGGNKGGGYYDFSDPMTPIPRGTSYNPYG